MGKSFYSFLFFGCAALVHAAPQSPTVAAGEAAFSQVDQQTLHIATSDRAIINWESFSVGAGELIRFIQPSDRSAVLNRVAGSLGSEIFGTLEANGRVILINPHGVLIGESGVIRTGGFLASTLDVADEEFLQTGTLPFEGRIISKEGAINHKGRIEATSFHEEGGRIFLVADTVYQEGSLKATDIAIAGNNVYVCQGSVTKGDTIRIGGGFQGADPEMSNAQLTFVDRDALINADGTETGGRVIIWSEEATAFYGTVEARGVNGGFAEVSSRGNLDFRGRVDLSADGGALGTLLLDPDQIDVMIGGGAAYADVSTFAAMAGMTVTIDPATLDAVGANVDLQATVDINFIDIVVLTTPGVSLTAQAGGNLSVLSTSAIQTNGGDITLLAGPFSGAPVPDPVGALIIEGPLDCTFGMTATTGNITGMAYDIVGFAQAALSTDTGNITLTASNFIGDVGMLYPLNATISTNTGAVSMHAGGDIFLFGTDISCNGVFAGVQIDLQADFDHDHVGDLIVLPLPTLQHVKATFGGGDMFFGGENIHFLAGPGSFPLPAPGQLFVVALSPPGVIELQAFNDITIQAGDPGAAPMPGMAGCAIRGFSDVLIRAGGNVLLEGGSVDGAVAAVLVDDPTGTVEVFAGGNISVIGGNSDVYAAAAIGGGINGLVPQFTSLFAGGDVLVQGGTVSDGMGIDNSAYVLSDITGTTKIYAQGSILCQNGTAGATALINVDGRIPPLIPTDAGAELRAGGDITLAQDLQGLGSFPVFIQADGTFPLWSAQAGSYLTGTPLASAVNVVSDGLGAYQADSTPLATGITITTGLEDLTLYSGNRFLDGTLSTLVLDNPTTPNATTLTSLLGDIAVAGFHNIQIDNTLTTFGNILVASMNDMVISASGSVAGAQDITLIVDEQNPTGNGGGVFTNNGLVTTTNPSQNIAIYAASGLQPPSGETVPNQTFLGTLSAIATWDAAISPLFLGTKYGTSYQSGGVYHGPGFGTNYVAGNGVFGSSVVWYKVPILTPAIFNQAVLALTDEERIPIDLDYIPRVWRTTFAIDAKTTPPRRREFLLQMTLDEQRMRLLDALFIYPLVGEDPR